MKKAKVLLLTILLTVGFSFQNCSIRCNCPVFEGEFFDIQGMDIVNYTTSSGDEIEENEVVEFPFYGSMTLLFDVDYVASNCRHNNSGGFSLMSSAYACSCLDNGISGSKNEKISSLNIVTLNDFNDDFMANDTINELINVRGTQLNVNEYLASDTSLIRNRAFEMDLSIPPSLNEEFKVKVFLELSTNETYEAESIPFIIR